MSPQSELGYNGVPVYGSSPGGAIENLIFQTMLYIPPGLVHGCGLRQRPGGGAGEYADLLSI